MKNSMNGNQNKYILSDQISLYGEPDCKLLIFI